jgi:phage gpG-like protein
MIINVTIVGGKELIERFKTMAPAIHAALLKKVTLLALQLEKHVKVDKLNGQVLNRISGALSRSIHNKVEQAGTVVSGIVFSSGDVKYARIHEYGGVTAPHVIEPKKASVLAFAGAGGGMVFAKRVNHPGSKMPERSFLRSSLHDMSTEISLGMKKSIVQAIQTQVHGKPET